MVKKIIYSVFVLIIIFLVGCKNGCQSSNSGKEFPDSMVGVWGVPLGPFDTQNWIIKFEDDGTVSKFVHRILGGPIVVADGGIYREGPDKGTYLVLTLGPVKTDYDPDSNNIKVSIEIDEYEMKFLAGTLEGRMIDTFTGTVSEDGNSWYVDWRNYGWLKGATEPDIDFVDKNPQKMTFKKINVDDLKDEDIRDILKMNSDDFKRK